MLSGAITKYLGLSHSERIKAWLVLSSQGCVVQMHDKGAWNFLCHYNLRRCSMAKQNNSFLLLFVPVKRCHMRKFTRDLRFQRGSPWPSWLGVGQQRGRHSTGAVAKRLHLETQVWNRERETFETSQLRFQWHTASYKATPPHPSQTLPPTEDQAFKYISL